MLDELADLARAGGLEVRRVGAPRSDLDAPLVQSSTCRVRGRVFVVLSGADPVDVQIDVLAAAIRAHASGLIEQRWLPPAVRQKLGPEERR